MRLVDIEQVYCSDCEEKDVCEKVICDVKEIPTIDAVPVVRCKDCKFYRKFRTKRYKQLIRLCYRMGKHDMEYPVNPDDFCSYGQRKEG